jgi:hypothetical protein
MEDKYLVKVSNVTIKSPDGEILMDNIPVTANNYSFSDWEHDKNIAIEDLYKKIDSHKNFIKLLYKNISDLKNSKYEDQFIEFGT